MIHRTVLMVVGLVACLGGVMTQQEPPVSPWQALNPALAGPVSGEVPEPQYQPTRFEDDGPQLTPEEEFLVNNMPFKLPFKMEKKQIAVAMKLVKEAAKPVVKSKVLRQSVSYLDEIVRAYVDDVEMQMYMSFVLDSLQDLYDGKEATQFHKFMRGFLGDLSGDEQTARSIDGVLRSTMQYVYNPVRSYFRNYVVDPFTTAVNGITKRIGNWMGSERTYANYPDNYSTWGERMATYARSFSDWTRQARMGLEVAARMLEVEDMQQGAESRSYCGTCGGVQPVNTGVDVE